MRLSGEKTVIALLLAVVGGAFLLGAILAADNGITLESFGYPGCLMIRATGKPCPLCGGMSTFKALLRGDFAAAWSANPFGALFVPTLAIVALGLAVALAVPRSIAPLLRSRPLAFAAWGWGVILLLVLVLSWIARLL